MRRVSSYTPISVSSRRRLARWLVGSPISDVERDLVLETPASTQGNRTASAPAWRLSADAANKITEYSGESLVIPRHERGDKVLRRRECPEGSSMMQESKTSSGSAGFNNLAIIARKGSTVSSPQHLFCSFDGTSFLIRTRDSPGASL